VAVYFGNDLDMWLLILQLGWACGNDLDMWDLCILGWVWHVTIIWTCNVNESDFPSNVMNVTIFNLLGGCKLILWAAIYIVGYNILNCHVIWQYLRCFVILLADIHGQWFATISSLDIIVVKCETWYNFQFLRYKCNVVEGYISCSVD
jgi:hypothetical protein